MTTTTRFACPVFLLLAACGKAGDGNPASPRPATVERFHVLSGGNVTDTVQARPAQALIVEIRDSTGRVQPGVGISFAALPPADTARAHETTMFMAWPPTAAFRAAVALTTDSVGRAQTLIGLGTVAGPTGIVVSVASLGIVDTVRYTVTAGSPAKLQLIVKDTLISTGGAYGLRATVSDRFGNSTSGPITYTAGPGVTVDASGTVVGGSAVARTFVALSSPYGRDTSRVSVVPKWKLVGERSTLDSATVFTLNADGSGLTRIIKSTSEYVAPERSAATGAVAYYEGDPAGSGSSISILDTTGSARMLVGPSTPLASASWPRWSSDGLWIYFIGQRLRTDGRSVWRIRADGTQLDSVTTLVANGYATPPAPSPDGGTVGVEDVVGLKLVNVASRTSTFVRSLCTMPRFSPDGTQIACIANYSVVVMSPDGSNRRVLPGGGVGP